MNLLARQIAFRAEIAAADDSVAPSSIGMEIYRDAYRGRLLAALEVGFERTRRWAGEEAFTAAACHYVLSHPPTGWTLDAYGAEFPATLESLFADDREVAELAWLEWHLQQAFAARDLPRFDPSRLTLICATAAEWDGLTFEMAPGFALRPIETDCVTLWEALVEGLAMPSDVSDLAGCSLAIWRSDLHPRYRVLPADEAGALRALADCRPLGLVAEPLDAERLGQWLTQWFADGIFSSARSVASEDRREH